MEGELTVQSGLLRSSSIGGLANAHNNWGKMRTIHSTIMSLNSNQCHNLGHVVTVDGIGTRNEKARGMESEFVLTPSRESVVGDLPDSQKVARTTRLCPSQSWLSLLMRRRRRQRDMTRMGDCRIPCSQCVPPSPRCTCSQRIADAE